MALRFLFLMLVTAGCGVETSAPPPCDNYRVEIVESGAWVTVYSTEDKVHTCRYFAEFGQEMCTWITEDYYDCWHIQRNEGETWLSVDGCWTRLW